VFLVLFASVFALAMVATSIADQAHDSSVDHLYFSRHLIEKMRKRTLVLLWCFLLRKGLAACNAHSKSLRQWPCSGVFGSKQSCATESYVHTISDIVSLPTLYIWNRAW